MTEAIAIANKFLCQQWDFAINLLLSDLRAVGQHFYRRIANAWLLKTEKSP
jgi:predicted ATPase with chaperone activity